MSISPRSAVSTPPVRKAPTLYRNTAEWARSQPPAFAVKAPTYKAPKPRRWWQKQPKVYIRRTGWRKALWFTGAFIKGFLWLCWWFAIYLVFVGNTGIWAQKRFLPESAMPRAKVGVTGGKTLDDAAVFTSPQLYVAYDQALGVSGRLPLVCTAQTYSMPVIEAPAEVAVAPAAGEHPGYISLSDDRRNTRRLSDGARGTTTSAGGHLDCEDPNNPDCKWQPIR